MNNLFLNASLILLHFHFQKNLHLLRNIPGLKLFLIAFSWAGITVLFPLIQNYMSIRITDWITFIQRFLFVLVITIPFDIRDINYDNNELKTLPQHPF